MNTFSDILKNKFLEEFSAISIDQLLLSLLLAFALGVFIVVIYRVTYQGVMFNKNFAFCLVLLSVVTSLVILTISTNIVLSLGMVGALSIVRFRTAVKEPMDTVFMFWAIVAGIITGAGYIPIAIIATLFIGAAFLALSMFGKMPAGSGYLVVLRYVPDAAAKVKEALPALPKHRVKTKNMTRGFEELILEVKLKEEEFPAVEALRDIEGVSEVNIVSCGSGTNL